MRISEKPLEGTEGGQVKAGNGYYQTDFEVPFSEC